MAVHLRLPAHPVGPLVHLAAHPRTWLIGAGTLLTAAAIAILALESANPYQAAQDPPAVATRGLATPAQVLVAGPDSSPPTEPSTVIQAPVMNVSADGRLGLAVAFVPAQVRAGAPLVIRFTIQNRSDATIGRVQIDASGPWDGYTIAEVTPAGSFERVSASQATIRSQIDLTANATGVVSLLAFPSQAGDAQFSFDLRQADVE